MFNRYNLAEPLIKYFANFLLVVLGPDSETAPDNESKLSAEGLSAAILSIRVQFSHHSRQLFTLPQLSR